MIQIGVRAPFVVKAANRLTTHAFLHQDPGYNRDYFKLLKIKQLIIRVTETAKYFLFKFNKPEPNASTYSPEDPHQLLHKKSLEMFQYLKGCDKIHT